MNYELFLNSMQNEQRQHIRQPIEQTDKLIMTIIPFEKMEKRDITAAAFDMSTGGLGITTDYALEPSAVVIKGGLKERKHGFLVWSKEVDDRTYRSGIQFIPAQNGKHGAHPEQSRPPRAVSVFEDSGPESIQRLAAAVFANTTEGILVTDTNGLIQVANKAFVKITGYTEAEAVGKNLWILKSDLQDAGFYTKMWKALRKTGTWRGNFWNRRKNGEIYPQETTINAIRNDRGKVVQYCGIFRDTTKQHKLEETLRMLSSTDGLTGLANRRSFDETLQKEWRRAQRDGYPLAIIVADIDNFKKFNDVYGHLEGDECLKKVGTTLKQAIHRAGDLAARYGGEEFLLLMPITRASEAAQIAESIRQNIEALKIPHEASDTCGFVTVSIGVASIIPQSAMRSHALFTMADKAMYQAKRQGKNRVINAE